MCLDIEEERGGGGVILLHFLHHVTSWSTEKWTIRINAVGDGVSDASCTHTMSLTATQKGTTLHLKNHVIMNMHGACMLTTATAERMT